MYTRNVPEYLNVPALTYAHHANACTRGNAPGPKHACLCLHAHSGNRGSRLVHPPAPTVHAWVVSSCIWNFSSRTHMATSTC